MKTIFRLTCLAIGLCFTALPAQAIEFEPYAGVGLGGVLIDAGLGSEKAFSGYGILGADLHENYGVEFRFGTTGNTGKTVIVPQTSCPGECEVPITLLVPTPATISVDWFVSYLFKLQYPVAESFTIYGLIGGTTLNSKYNFAPLGRTVHSTRTTLSYGGGIDYDLGNRWITGVDWMIYANEADTSAG
ncbi:MAG: outer membrane beta-barrel protein, partial [Mariprofundaceae bacterium]